MAHHHLYPLTNTHYKHQQNRNKTLGQGLTEDECQTVWSAFSSLDGSQMMGFDRDDEVYDIIVELDYNQSPTIRNKGSAIFIHCSFDDSRDTKGCIALKKNNLKHLINNLQKINYIYIR